MKVVFNTYPMAFHTPGGGEVQLEKYKQYLEAEGVQVDRFNLWDPHFLDYDLMHFFSLMGGSHPFCRFVKDLKLPLVITSSLWITEQTKHLYPFDEIKHQLSFADRVITNSHVESEQMASVFNMPIEKFSVVYNGVDEVFFDRISPDIFRKKFKIEGPFILNIGNIEPRKNQLNLIAAIKKHPDLTLVTVGHIRNPDYAKQCFEAGGDQFVFLGPLEHASDLHRSAYAACELFALPSTLETPGLAALEAAAAGVTMVVTGVGAPREYFGDEAWYVDEPLRVDEIARVIGEALCAKKAVPNKVLSDRVRKQYSWESVVKSLVKVYSRLLS